MLLLNKYTSPRRAAPGPALRIHADGDAAWTMVRLRATATRHRQLAPTPGLAATASAMHAPRPPRRR